ncbi:MAG: hypothetical protein ACR2I0_10865, partial [Rhodoferax sp.]
MTAPSLWQRVRAEGLSTLAVLGMTKNTGKTVTLNHLLACAADAGLLHGVTSIGRDGEAQDQVFAFPKPPIMVWPGTLVATARDTLARSKVPYQMLAGTGIDSPMGEVLLVRARGHGAMEVAGASRSSDLQTLIALQKAQGCSLVLLDGALGRSHHASPAVADGVVLATGAALGGGVQDVLRKTRERLALLAIAPAEEPLRALCAPVFAQGGVGAWDGQGRLLLLQPIATLNAAPALLALAACGVQTIAVSGAVGRALWQGLLELAQGAVRLTLVVTDGTRLFVEAAQLAALARLGGELRAWHAIRVVGLTLNPFSPLGTSFSAPAFLAEAR